MKFESEKSELEKMYPVGTRIQLVHMDDPHPLKPGVYSVGFIDDACQIHLKESSLALIPGTDIFKKIM